MNEFWRAQLERARDATELVCGLCEKPTARTKAELRHRPEQHRTNPGMDPLDSRYRADWKCSNCGAWHPYGATEDGEPAALI